MTQMLCAYRLVSISLLATAFVACGSNPVEMSGPGTLRGTLQSPHGVEGAAVIELVGSGLGLVRVESGLVFTSVSGDATRAVILRHRPGVIEFAVEVPDRGSPPDVRILEVADGDDQLRSSLDGYAVRFAAVPSSPERSASR